MFRQYLNFKFNVFRLAEITKSGLSLKKYVVEVFSNLGPFGVTLI